VADCIEFGNGMAVTPDNSTSIVAESFGCRLTAFDIAADGSLSNRRCGSLSSTSDEVPDRGPAPVQSRSPSEPRKTSTAHLQALATRVASPFRG